MEREPADRSLESPSTDLAAAQATLLRCIRLWEAFVRENPDVPGFRNDLANVYNKLGLLQSAREIHEESIHYTSQAIVLWEDLRRDAPADPLYRDALVVAYGQLQHCLMDSGQPEAEEPVGLKAISLSEGLVAEFPDVPQYRQDLAACLLFLGRRCIATRRTAEAEAAYRRAVDLSRELLTRFPVTPAAFDVLSRSSVGLISLAHWKGDSQEEIAKLRRELIPFMEKIAAENRNRPDELARATAALGYLELSHLLTDNVPMKPPKVPAARASPSTNDWRRISRL